MSIDFNTVRNWAIILIFVVLFGTAAWDKFKSGKTPDWFIKQFENTFIAKMPGGTALGYWKIATLEAVLTLAFLASLVLPALLPFALVSSLFMFGFLLFGLRLINDFQGSANMFIYFTATLVSLFLVHSF